jgi:transcriptional regulator with XRE-family HTH domain
MAWFNALKSLRRDTGYTAIETAKKLGLPYTTYVSYEQGKREPSINCLIKLANYFDVPLDTLLDRNDEVSGDDEEEPSFSEMYGRLSAEKKRKIDKSLKSLMEMFDGLKDEEEEEEEEN